MSPRPACGLYLVTPVGLASGALPLEDFAASLEAALDAAAIEALLLRTAGQEGRLEEDALARRLERLLPLVHRRGVPLLLEERADLVARHGCDGIHLAAERSRVAAVRRALGPDAIVGAGCGDSRHAAMEAGEAGADYLAFGLFDPEPQPPDPELLAWWQEMMELPAVALGGITLENAAALAAAGADFIALRHAVWNHPRGAAAAVAAFARALA